MFGLTSFSIRMFIWLISMKMFGGDISSPSFLPSCAPLVRSDQRAMFAHILALFTIPPFLLWGVDSLVFCCQGGNE